jgi:hypothetical protein
LKEATNGTAAATAPTTPVAAVATVRKCRLVNPELSVIPHFVDIAHPALS